MWIFWALREYVTLANKLFNYHLKSKHYECGARITFKCSYIIRAQKNIIQIIIAANNISLLFLFSEEMRSIALSPHLMVASKMSISATKREIFSLRLQPKLGVQTVHSSQCCGCFFIFLSIAKVWLRAKSKCFTSSRLRCLQLILRYIHTASNRSILSKLLSNFL